MDMDEAIDNEVAVLRAVGLKGRPQAADVAVATGTPESEVTRTLSALAARGTCKEVNGRFMLSPDGKRRLEELLEAERATLDPDVLRPLYDEFTELNGQLKEIMHSWQIRDGQPNDHADAGYDAAVIDRLRELADSFAPLMERIAAAIPRLAPYPDRFSRAIKRIGEGDHSWIAKPIADSFHTVWFELHEELIAALGLSREAEALSGRAE